MQHKATYAAPRLGKQERADKLNYTALKLAKRPQQAAPQQPPKHSRRRSYTLCRLAHNDPGVCGGHRAHTQNQAASKGEAQEVTHHIEHPCNALVHPRVQAGPPESAPAPAHTAASTPDTASKAAHPCPGASRSSHTTAAQLALGWTARASATTRSPQRGPGAPVPRAFLKTPSSGRAALSRASTAARSAAPPPRGWPGPRAAGSRPGPPWTAAARSARP